MNKYELTKEGISAFLEAVMEDIMDRHEYNPIQITIGSHTISASTYPETYELTEELLKTALQIEEEEM